MNSLCNKRLCGKHALVAYDQLHDLGKLKVCACDKAPESHSSRGEERNTMRIAARKRKRRQRVKKEERVFRECNRSQATWNRK